MFKILKKIITYGVGIVVIYLLSAVPVFAEETDVNSWMPDPVLQEQVAFSLGVSTNELTPELMKDKTFSLHTTFDTPYVAVVGQAQKITDFTGIEFAGSYSIVISGEGSGTTQSAIDTHLTDHFANLEHINWYGNAQTYSQIDWYTLLHGWSQMGNVPTYGGLHITGDIDQLSKAPLAIPVSAYEAGGTLTIPLSNIGFWTGQDYQLFKDPDSIYLLDRQYLDRQQLVIKVGDVVLATYDYDTFDVASQSFVFKFNSEQSQSPEVLSGQELLYSLDPNPNTAFNMVPSFEVAGNPTYWSGFEVSDILTPGYPMSRVAFYFEQVIFLPITKQVTFNSNGGSPVDNQTVETGELIEKPTDPTQENYVFDGWYTDQELTNGYDFATPVAQDMTLYAKWTKIDIPAILAHEITFNSNGGSLVDSQNIETGQVIEKPADPVKDGYLFDGWYTDQELTGGYNFVTPVTQDMTLYARWTKLDVPATLTHEITFNSNGGSLVDGQTVETGQVIEKPVDPIKEGYLFDGWYTNQELTDIYNFEDPVAQDIVLYAKWKNNPRGISDEKNSSDPSEQSKISTTQGTVPEITKKANGSSVSTGSRGTPATIARIPTLKESASSGIKQFPKTNDTTNKGSLFWGLLLLSLIPSMYYLNNHRLAKKSIYRRK